MTIKFHVGAYTGSPLYQRDCFDRVWSLLADPIVSAKRWGPVERTTEPFTSEPAEAFASLRRKKSLFVDGACDGFQMMVNRVQGSLYDVNLWIAQASIDDELKRRDWLAWTFRLLEAMPVLFAHGEIKPEHDAKHLDESVDRRRWIGASLRELMAFLPGIYWLTVFGHELRQTIDVERLAGMPEVTVHQLASDQTAVVLNEPPTPPDMAARLALERRVAGMLGDDYFFDRERADRDLKTVTGFAAELERLQRQTPPANG